MKKSLFVASFLLLFFAAAGCVSSKRATKIDSDLNSAILPPYSGPKAKITLTGFDVKAAKATSEIGVGLYEMLATVLTGSKRFLVLECQQVNTMAKEADLIIAVAVTEFEPQASGGRAGIGGGGGVGSGVLGGLLGTAANKAHMALDIRIVDASTSEVLASKSVQGQASDIAGGAYAGLFGSTRLGAGLSAYANTPMEKAIRECIVEALRYIAQTIPANYYKY